MPEDSELSTPDLPSFSESVTLPYEELRELKAVAAAVSCKKDLSVTMKSAKFPHEGIFQLNVSIPFRLLSMLALQTKRMSCNKVNGLGEGAICRKGDSGACCKASSEVAQVSNVHTQHCTSYDIKYSIMAH